MKTTVLTRKFRIGPCMDVQSYQGRLYAIQNALQFPGGRLCVLSPQGELLAAFEGIGNARQIEIRRGVAFVTARAGGLWIFDVQEKEPRLLSHYKTIEYACGVTLYAQYAFISCRQYGVEVVDVSDPSRPVHARLIRTGEVQSCCVADGILYGGIWGTMQVLAVDIRDLAHPRILSRMKLDGRGDGVCVRDGILYAACGQHAPGLKNPTDTSDPCFGHGNGLDLYDVSDPERPVKKGFSSFGYGHSIQYDMWDVNLFGDLVVCNDSVCGVRVFDLRGEPQWRLSFDDSKTAATGVCSCEGALYIASTAGLYRFDGLNFPAVYRHDVPPKPSVSREGLEVSGVGVGLHSLYRSEDPVLAVCAAGRGVALAQAGGGVALLDETYTPVTRKVLPGIACDVDAHGKFLYTAQSEEGVWKCQMEAGEILPLAHRSFPDPVTQLKLSPSGKFLLVGCGETEICLLDADTLEVLSRRPREQGPLYGGNFCSHTLSDGTMLTFWHRDGLVWINPDAGEREFHHTFYPKRTGFIGFGPESGCDTDGERIYYGLDRGYIFLTRQSCEIDDQPIHSCEAAPDGKILVAKGRIYAAERARGKLTVLDVSDPLAPRALAEATVNCSPEKPVEIDGKILLPAWYGGLMEINV